MPCYLANAYANIQKSDLLGTKQNDLSVSAIQHKDHNPRISLLRIPWKQAQNSQYHTISKMQQKGTHSTYLPSITARSTWKAKKYTLPATKITKSQIFTLQAHSRLWFLGFNSTHERPRP